MLSNVGQNVVNVKVLNLASEGVAVRVAFLATSSLKVMQGTACSDKLFLAKLAYNMHVTVDLWRDLLHVVDVSLSRVDQGEDSMNYGTVVHRTVKFSVA